MPQTIRPQAGTYEPREPSLSRRSLLKASGTVAGAAALLAIEGTRPRSADASIQSESLEGSWRADVRRDPLPPVTTFYTFIPGGTLVQSDTDRSGGLAHGSWVKTGDREYDGIWVRP